MGITLHPPLIHFCWENHGSINQNFDSCSFKGSVGVTVIVQGDTSDCAKPPVDIDLKVAF